MTEQTIADIILFLLHTQFYIKLELLSQVEQYQDLLKTEPVQFHDEIFNQFSLIAKQKISDIIGKNLGSDAESIALALDGLNIREYLLQ